MVHVAGGRGFVWGFREGQGDLSSGLSQPGGKKLLSSLAERAPMFWYRGGGGVSALATN